VEFLEQCREGAAAVTDRELCLEIDFGHGAFEFREIEQRIVAEAASPALLIQLNTFDRATVHSDHSIPFH